MSTGIWFVWPAQGDVDMGPLGIAFAPDKVAAKRLGVPMVHEFYLKGGWYGRDKRRRVYPKDVHVEELGESQIGGMKNVITRWQFVG